MKHLVILMMVMVSTGCAQFWPRTYAGIAEAKVHFLPDGNVTTIELHDGKERSDMYFHLINSDGAEILVSAEAVTAPDRDGLAELLLSMGIDPVDELLDEIIMLARGSNVNNK